MCSSAHYTKVRVYLENNAPEFCGVAEELAEYLEDDPDFTEDDWNDPIIFDNYLLAVAQMIQDCKLDEEWERTHPEY